MSNARRLAVVRRGLDATKAAEALASSLKIGPATKRLNVADHSGILNPLRFATESIYGKDGLLAATLRAIEVRQGYYAAVHTDTGRDFARSLGAVYDMASRAKWEAAGGNVDPAFQRVRVDLRELAVQQSPAAVRSARRGKVVVARITEATAAINHFTAAMDPGEAVIEDVLSALGCGADTVRALMTACLEEAELITAAYEAARIGKRAAFPSEAMGDAGKALERAYKTMSEATEAVRRPANRETELLEAAGSGR